MVKAKRAEVVLAFFILAAILAPSSDIPTRLDPWQRLARPYLYPLAFRETQRFVGFWLAKGREFFHQETAAEQEKRLVERYFHLGEEIASLRASLAWEEASGETLKKDKEHLALLQEERNGLQRPVERILESWVGQVFEAEGLSWRWWGGGWLLPPVAFRFEKPPNLLVVSPRSRVQLLQTVLLNSGLSLEAKAELEAKVAALGYSGLVEEIGGVATYPSLVLEGVSVETALDIVAHEWLHQYLFFRPLGQHYGDSPEMRTLNESAAELVGKEVASQVQRLYWPEKEKQRRESAAPEPSRFNFNKEMRAVRLAVEEYLARGEISQAEAFMEEKRRYLMSHGYFLRKLNQAYFAFHGTYADSPASISPIGDELGRLRQRSPSLGAFIQQLASFSSYNDLKKALGEAARPEKETT